jgi:hypothetical protein
MQVEIGKNRRNTAKTFYIKYVLEVIFHAVAARRALTGMFGASRNRPLTVTALSGAARVGER